MEPSRSPARSTTEADFKRFGNVTLHVGMEGCSDGAQLGDVVVERSMHRSESVGAGLVEYFVATFPQKQGVILKRLDILGQQAHSLGSAFVRRSCVHVLVDESPVDAHKSATKIRPSDNGLGCDRTLNHHLECQGVGSQFLSYLNKIT